MLDSFISTIGNHGCSGINAVSGQVAHLFCGASSEAGAQGVQWLHPRGIGFGLCAISVLAVWGLVNGAGAVLGARKDRLR